MVQFLSATTSHKQSVSLCILGDRLREIQLYSKVETVGSCRFQIHLCILAYVMSRELTREAVMKFLPAQFP